MNHYEPKNILVTGGAGFIGSNFIHYLLSFNKKFKIINLDALTYASNVDNLKALPNSERYQFIHGNICDRSLVESVLSEYEIDTIVHFAAESHVDRSIQNPLPFIEANIVGTFILLESAKNYWQKQFNLDPKHCRFHHISTDEVFGSLKKQDAAFTETSLYKPNSPYSASKAGSDHLVHAYFQTYHFPITTSHCSNNYGPLQHPEKFIPKVIHHCLNKQPIPIYGDGSNIRDWLYVTDHCEALLKILEQGIIGETYNIGGQNEHDNLTVSQLICKLMDKHSPSEMSYEKLITFVQDRPGHDWRYAIDHTKMSTQLGWQPRHNFMMGLEKTIGFYLHNSLIPA